MNELQKKWSARIETIGLKKSSFAKHLNITHSYLSRLLASEKSASPRLTRDIEFVLNTFEEATKEIKQKII